MIIKIVSSEKGKQCDLFPSGSIHQVEKDEKGELRRGSNGIDPNFDIEVLDESAAIKTKDCPVCGLLFAADTPFVKANQVGDKDMCMRCYERKYVVGRDEYKEAVRIELLNELCQRK